MLVRKGFDLKVMTITNSCYLLKLVLNAGGGGSCSETIHKNECKN